jgi:hypothetical protein
MPSSLLFKLSIIALVNASYSESDFSDFRAESDINALMQKTVGDVA